MTTAHVSNISQIRTQSSASTQRRLYLLGAGGALGVLAAVAVQAPAFILYPPPETIGGHFALLHTRPVIGLLGLDLTLLLAQLFTIPALIGLFAAFRRAAPTAAALALGLGLGGVALFLAVNPTFSMLYLSQQYYAAGASATQQAALLAAGEALWANYNGTAFGLFFILTGLADLILARLMWKAPAFGRLAAGTGMAMGAMLFFPPLPPFGTIPLVLSYAVILPSVMWQVFVARGLLRLARQEA